MTETLLDGDPQRYEQRYTTRLLGQVERLVRRPIAIAPADGTVCFVDNGPREGPIPRNDASVFKDGKFRRVRFEPTHWTVWDD